MSDHSILDGDDSIEVVSPNVKDTVGEIKKRRGRPPGSRNKPKQDDGLATNLENAIRGLFGLMAVIAEWFGYRQTEELSEDEATQGAKAFVPIALKFPWLASIATYIGAPVWLIRTIQKKFRRKHGIDSSGNGNRGASGVDVPTEIAANDSR